MHRNCQTSLAMAGWYLDQWNLPDAFISVDHECVTVTPVTTAQCGQARVFSHDALARLSADLAISRRKLKQPTPGGHSREVLLLQAGERLGNHPCRRAFIVVYSDLVIVDAEAFGTTETLMFTALTPEHAVPGRPMALARSPARVFG